MVTQMVLLQDVYRPTMRYLYMLCGYSRKTGKMILASRIVSFVDFIRGETEFALSLYT